MVPRCQLALISAILLALLVPAVAPAATDYRSTVLEDDPTLYFRLGELAGSQAQNLGRHGGTATIGGTPELGVLGALESDESGDRAIRMHADGDYIRAFPEPDAAVAGSWTAEAWVRVDRFTDGNLFDPPTRLTIGPGGWGTFNNWWFAPGATLGAWHHVVMTATPTQVEVFLDGVSRGTSATVGAQTLYDGGTWFTVGWGLAGTVDEVAAYDRVLTPGEIAEHHRAGVQGFGAAAPVNVTPPAVSGEAKVGATARCSTGTWSGGPREFDVRWLRGSTVIAGATRSDYTITSADLGQAIRCGVSARNLAGVSVAVLSPGAVTLPAAPAAGSYRDLVLQDNPRMYLPLDERSGTTPANLGSDGGGAELNGTPLVGVYGAIEADDPSDRGVRFDGNDHLVLAPAGGATVAGDWTVEAWVRTEAAGFNGSIFNNDAEIRVEEDRLTTPYGFFAKRLQARTWHHVAMVSEGGDDGSAPSVELFVDGVSYGVKPGYRSAVYGAFRQTLGWAFTGWLDEPAVYDYRLAPERIAEHHRRGSEGFAPVPPTVRTAPSVSGSAVVGATAVCDEGDWAGGPRRFTYRWLRDGVPIAGADEREYAISAHDRTADVTCDVVAHNVAGASARVASTDAVAMPDDAAPATYADMVLDDNPTMYLRLEEREGATTAKNLGSHGGDARIDGNPALGLYGALESDEPSDRAIRLDGNDSLRFRPEPGSTVVGDFTVEGWVRLDRSPAVPGTMFNHDAEIRIEPHAIVTPPARLPHTLSVGAWHHVVAVSRGGDRDVPGWIEVFVDGKSIGRQPAHRRAAYSDNLSQTLGWDLYGWLDEMAIYDYRLTPERIREHHLRGTTGFGAAAPAVRVAPSVAGQPIVGRTATCDEGEWTGGPRTFDVQWLRDGVAIEDAKEKRYTVSATDLGTRLTCTVVARNAAGASPVVGSASSIAVPAAPGPASYHALVALDNPVMHLPLTDVAGGVTANRGSHGGHALITGDPVRSGGAVFGDEDPGLHLDGDDHVTFVPREGEKVVGDWTAEGWIHLDRDTGDTHLFTGDATLRIDPWTLTTWSGRFSPGVGNGAWHHVAMTMRQGDRDRGGQMEVFVDGVSHGRLPAADGQSVYVDRWYQIFGWHLAGGIDELAVYDYRLTPQRILDHYRGGNEGVVRPYPTVVTPPTVSGEARVGSVVTCGVGTWTGSPSSYDVRWTRNGIVIAGATAVTYTLSPEDSGSVVSCSVAATNAEGTSARASATDGVGVPYAPRNLTRPHVVGIAQAGVTVSCSPGEWDSVGTREVRWQLSTGGVVTEATGDTYAVTAADGARLRCLVRLSNSGGESAWAESDTVIVDSDPPVVAITCPSAPLIRGSEGWATYTASDAGSGLATPAGGTIALDTSSAGTFTARVTARDVAGRATEGSCTYRVVNARPSAPTPSTPASSNGLITLDWSVAGAPEAARYEVQWRRDEGSTWTAPVSTVSHPYALGAPLGDGAWRFRVRAVDADYETAWSDESGPVSVDRTPPVISLASCPTAPVIRGTGASATFTASDAGSGLVTAPSGTLTLDTSTAGQRTASITARDLAGHEATASCTYRVIHARPSAPAPSAPASADGLVRLDWSVAGGSPEPARYELQWRRDDSSTWTAPLPVIAHPHTLASPLADGTWRFRVRAVDPDFDTAWSEESSAVSVDRTPPTVTLAACPSSPLMYGETATVSFTASDVGSGLVTPASGSITLDTNTAGMRTASVTARDQAGHQATASCMYRVLHPRPFAPIPAATASTDGLVKLDWSVASGSPEAARYDVQWRRDDGTVWSAPVPAASHPYTLTAPLADGTWRFRVRAVDPNFVDAWSEESVAVSVDRTPPVVSITCPSAPIVRGASAVAPFTASDAGSGLVTPASGSVTLETDTAGVRTATVIARDRAGHETQASCTYRVLHPRPSAPMPASTASADGLVKLDWSVASGSPDAARYDVQWRRDDGTVWSAPVSVTGHPYTLTAPLADGTWRFRVRAVDPNFDTTWSEESVAVSVDRTPPVASITCPPDPIVRGTSASAPFTASDAGSGLATPATGSVALDTATAGVRTASVTARDRAGHETTASCTYRVVYRRPGAPVVSSGAVPSPNGVLSLTWPTLDGSEPNPVRYELQARDANDGAWTTVSSPTTRAHAYTSTAALAEGTWRFRVRGVDPSFDSAWSAESVAVVVDRSAPNPPSVSADRAPDYSGTSGDWYRDSVTVGFLSAGDRVLADGSPGVGVSLWTLTGASTFSASGTHTASGTIADAVGHVSAASSLTVRVDATAPSLTVSCPAAELRVGDTASATWVASDAHSRLATPATGTRAADTATAGDRTLVIVARDNVGHETTRTCAYRVVFPKVQFAGSLRTDRDNVVDIGTVVPIQFDLGGDFGLGVLDGTPVVTEVPCGVRAKDFKAKPLPAGSSGLLYDTANDYRWAFRIDPAWMGTCRRLTIRLDDGITGSWTFAFE